MVKQNFAGEMLLEWFSQNHEGLASRGFKVDRALSDPEAFWIEPSAFIEFETAFCLGLFEMTRFGFLSLFVFDKQSDSEGKIQNWLCLEPSAIVYRQEHDINQVPQGEEFQGEFVISQPKDYSTILEPIIYQLLPPATS
jgi:hypothetical protein